MIIILVILAIVCMCVSLFLLGLAFVISQDEVNDDKDVVTLAGFGLSMMGLCFLLLGKV